MQDPAKILNDGGRQAQQVMAAHKEPMSETSNASDAYVEETMKRGALMRKEIRRKRR